MWLFFVGSGLLCCCRVGLISKDLGVKSRYGLVGCLYMDFRILGFFSDFRYLLFVVEGSVFSFCVGVLILSCYLNMVVWDGLRGPGLFFCFVFCYVWIFSLSVHQCNAIVFYAYLCYDDILVDVLLVWAEFV